MLLGGSKEDAALQRLGIAVENRLGDYEALANRRDADGDMQDRALELVREFIIRKGLVLFGGLAIDYALRLKGDSIYPEGKRPDFDVYSPQSVEDAYELADVLHRAGFKNVSAIRAIHVQTMRVRTDFITVADIGYMPRALFEQLPALEWNGVRVIHPDYQRMDMHLAFCYPFNDPPREDVFHRWSKDLRRYNLLSEYYMVVPGRLAKSERGGAERKNPIVRVNLGAVLSLVALNGFAAYGVLRASLDELIRATKSENKVTAPLLHVGVGEEKGATVIEFRPPESAGRSRLIVCSPEPEKVLAALPAGGRISEFRPVMEARPAMTVVELEQGGLEIYSTKSRLLSVAAVKTNGVQLLTISAQGLLLYFLSEAHMAKCGEDELLMTQFYNWTLEIINRASEIVQESSADPVIAEKFINSSPFFPSTRVLGSVNQNESYKIRMARAVLDVGGPPMPPLPPDFDAKSYVNGLPLNYYPDRRESPGAFDYGANPLFLRSGEEIKD